MMMTTVDGLDAIREDDTWTITSGEGEVGTEEEYTGKLSLRAMRARLTKETCGGDRWAYFACNGERIDLDHPYLMVTLWTPDRSPTGHATAVKGGPGPHYVSKDAAIAAARKMWRCNE